MPDQQAAPVKTRWRRASQLPQDVFAALQKADRAINPITIVATVDEDGTPRTAPFGSLRAVSPSLLRLASLRFHDTFANLCRDGRVTVALLAPPGIAVSIRGRARVVRACMQIEEESAILEIDVEEVKNDMPLRGRIESGPTLSVSAEAADFFRNAIAEIEGL